VLYCQQDVDRKAIKGWHQALCGANTIINIILFFGSLSANDTAFAAFDSLEYKISSGKGRLVDQAIFLQR
jgi:hypothetical protein